MKTLKTIILATFVIFSTNAIAQYGYGNNGMNGGGMYGGSARQNSMNMQSANYSRDTKSPEQIEKEKIENINKTVEQLRVDLNLDELQLIVIRKEIEENSKSFYQILKSEATEEEKTKAVEAASEKTDRIINSYLNEDQKLKYKKYIEDRKEKLEKIKSRRSRN